MEAWLDLIVSFGIRAQCSRTNPVSAKKQRQKQNKIKRNTMPFIYGAKSPLLSW